MLKLTLFGTPQVTIDGRNLTAALAGRPLALLAYLAVTGKAHDRTVLSDLLWHEVGETDARRNLRNALYLLGQAVGGYLRRDRQTVALDSTRPYWLDVAIFAEQARAEHRPPSAELMQELLDLYQGAFLAGLHINDAPTFESWVATRRHQLEEQAFDGWLWLANHYLEHQAYSAGLAVTRRMLAIQPWREEAHRQQMLLLAASGQRSAALVQYEQCRHLLTEELAVEPMSATIALYEQLKRGEGLPLSVPATSSNLPQPVPFLSVAPSILSRGSDTISAQHQLPPIRTDLGAMPSTTHFQGRTTEIALLHEWLLVEKRRCVAIVGIGGQGKTALAAHFVASLLDHASPGSRPPANGRTRPGFDYVIWRSLLNAPPLAELLHDWLHLLSAQQPIKVPVALDQQFSLLLQQLQQQRCLLVLDNWESILPSSLSLGLPASTPAIIDLQAYGQLLRLFLQSDHQSSLLLTSREQPQEITRSEEVTGAARCLLLTGLDPATGIQLLTQYGLHCAPPTLAPLVAHFSGNPLALKLVIDTIEHLFGGDVATFLAQESHFFGDIGALLDHQFAQLSPMQRMLLYWLAIERESVTAQTLWENLVQPVAQRHFWEALRALQRRSLVETHEQRFGLQNVILEYATERLVEQMVQGVIDLVIPSDHAGHELTPFNQYSVLKAETSEYIRQMQRRLLLAPIAQQLVMRWGVAGLAARVQTLVGVLRMSSQTAPSDGYAAANLLTLLLHCRVDLRGYDFSYLTLRQAYLCDAVLPSVNFTFSRFCNAAFTDPFEVVGALTFTPDGQWLITGSYDGLLRLWHAQDGRLHTALDGNQREIGRLLVSPDSMWLASACADNQVVIWHLPSLTHHATWRIAANFPHPLAFSPDSQWLALDGGEGVIKVLTVSTGEQSCLLGGMTSQPRVLAFSPDGAFIAAGSSDGLLYLWALCPLPAIPLRQPALVWRGHQSRILALLFTLDSRRLVSGGVDRRITCWSMAPVAACNTLSGAPPAALPTPEVQWSVIGHNDLIVALALGADGHLLASGSPDRTIRLWDMTSGALLTTLDTEEQRVRALAFAADGKTLASGGSNQRIYLWSVAWVMRPSAMETVTTYLRQTIHGYANQVRTIAFLPQHALLVSGGTDKALHLWDIYTGQQKYTWPGHAGWIQTIAVSPDGAMIASADYAQQIYLWAATNPTGVYQILANRFPSGHFFIDLCFSPDGQWLAGGSGATITLWSLPTHAAATRALHPQAPAVIKQRLTVETGTVSSLAFHPQRDLLAGVTVTGDLYLWRISDGALLQRLPRPSQCSTVIAFSPDGQTLVSAGMDETIDCWAIDDERATVCCHWQKTLCRQSGRTVTLAVDPQGKSLATGTYDGLVYLWDWQTGTLLHQLHEQQGWITKVSYSPDGKILASAATDGTIKLWCVAGGLCLQTLCFAGPYANMNITNSSGLTPTQRAALKALGAIERLP